MPSKFANQISVTETLPSRSICATEQRLIIWKGVPWWRLRHIGWLMSMNRVFSADSFHSFCSFMIFRAQTCITAALRSCRHVMRALQAYKAKLITVELELRATERHTSPAAQILLYTWICQSLSDASLFIKLFPPFSGLLISIFPFIKAWLNINNIFPSFGKFLHLIHSFDHYIDLKKCFLSMLRWLLNISGNFRVHPTPADQPAETLRREGEWSKLKNPQ